MASCDEEKEVQMRSWKDLHDSVTEYMHERRDIKKRLDLHYRHFQ